jgi:putative peptidoglycan lipid II flippase
MPESSKPATPRSRKRISFGNAAFLLVATMMIGQVIGFFRTMIINGNFPDIHGAQSTDAYFAAFIIPDFFFYAVAAGALGVAFMPVLADRLHKGDRKGMWELTTSLLNLLSIVMLVVAVIIFAFAEPLSHLVGPGLTPEQRHNTVVIMRLIALNPFLFAVSGVLTSAQQTMGRFFFFALSPLFYNICIIASVYLFANTSIGIIGLGIGALVGGILQLLIVSLGLIGTKFTWRPKIMWRSEDFKTILRQLPTRSLDQGVDQVLVGVETRIASKLASGSITYYNNAYILHMAPILLIGTAISTAAFPQMNARLSQGRPDLFRKEFVKALRTIIWITIPVVIICYVSRGYLARLIFKTASNEIAVVFGFLTVAILFRAMYAIISRWFYSQKDSKTPLFVSIFTIALNVTLAMLLARETAYGIAGLAIAQSITALVEVSILIGIMMMRDRGIFNRDFWAAGWKIISVSGFTLISAAIVIKLFPLNADDRGFITLGTKLAFIALTIAVTHIVISGLFGLDEAKAIFDKVKKVITKPLRVDY